MQPYDVLMVAVLAVATVFGAYKGMAWQLASISSIVVSYFVSFRFRTQVAELIDAEPPWNQFAAMLILYLGTSLIIWVIFRVVKQAIDRVKLREFDHQIGALFGIAKGVLLCVVITFFAVTLTGDVQRQRIVDSYSGHYIARLLQKSHPLLPKEVDDVLHPYLNKLETELQTDHPVEHGTPHSAAGDPAELLR